MTSRERMLAAIRCENVDHIPLGQIFHSTVTGTPGSLRWRDQFERAKVMLDLGIDPSIDIWMPVPEAPPDVPVRTWREKDTDSGGRLLCAEYDTPAGKLVQKVRQTPDWWDRTHYKFLPDWDGFAHRTASEYDRIEMMDDWFTRRYEVPLVSGTDDLDKLEFLLKAPKGGARDRWIENAFSAKRIADDMGLLTHARRVSVGDWFMWLCLIEDFLCASAEDTSYAERFFDIIQSYNREILELVMEVQPDVIQYRGWYDTPDYWGRERFSAILKPRIELLAGIVHDGGSLFCYLLTEGYTIYREVLKEMPVDVYLGLEPLAARKSEDLKAVKETFSGGSCIWGGVNAPVSVGRGTDEDIDKAVKTAVETLGPEGLILNACMVIYDDDVPWDRFLELVAAWKHYRG